MRRSAAVGIVIALFLVGVAVGALGTNLVNRHRTRLGAHTGFVASELHHRLGLNGDQRRQLDAILADSRREAMALWQQMRPRLEAVIERAEDRIEPILTPEQRREFERYRQEHARHLSRLLHSH